MSQEIQLNASWSLDKKDLLFTQIGKDPETCYFYYIPRKELLTPLGFHRWFTHLCEKTWFTYELKQQLIEIVRAASNE